MDLAKLCAWSLYCIAPAIQLSSVMVYRLLCLSSVLSHASYLGKILPYVRHPMKYDTEFIQNVTSVCLQMNLIL